MKWLLPFLTLLILQPCTGQYVEQRVAHEAVMKFLEGVRASATPEGKQILAETQWITGRADRGTDFYARPAFTEVASRENSLFNADLPAIRGFKEVFDMMISTTTGTRNSRFLVIAFKDAGTGKWKILSSLQDVDESILDMDRRIGYYRDRLDDTTTSSERENYTNYALWLLRSGQIVDAKEALKKAKTASATSDLEDAVKEGPDRIRDLQIDALLDLIAKIAPNLR